MALAFLLASCGDGGGGDVTDVPDADDPGEDVVTDVPADVATDEPGPDCTTGDPTIPSAPHFVDVTSSAGLGAGTYGFGRVMVVDVDGDGLDDIVGTPTHDGSHSVPPAILDKLVLRNRGDGTFEDVTSSSGLEGALVGLLVFGDVDNDGDQDAYAGTIPTSGQSGWGVWLNDGTGSFAHAGENGTELLQMTCGDATCTGSQIAATFADLDGDGNLDLYVGAWFWSDWSTDTRWSPPGRDQLYRGLGDGTFQNVSAGLPNHNPPHSGVSSGFGRAAMGITAGDYDNDGDVDLFVANYGAGRPVGPGSSPICQPPMYWDQNLLWRNDGSMSLSNVAEAAGVHATMRGPSGIASEETLVVGTECPEDVRGTYPSPIGGNHFTPQWGDFDNDGDLDLVVGAISHPDYVQSDPTMLFVNQGAPDWDFIEESLDRGLVYREDEKHVHWVDLDNDGLLDIVATGLRAESENELRIYLQDADHDFVLQSASTTGIDDRRQEALAFLDYDMDGDLDLYLAEDDGQAKLLRNDAGNANRSIAFRLVASAPADATGARVTVGSSAGPQLREVVSGSGHYNVQPSRVLYFGLAGDTCATDVIVRWPDGTEQALGDMPAGRLYLVTQGADPTVGATF
jgi:hypothetical protein